MPKLVLDKMAMQLSAERLRGQPVFFGPGGMLLSPGVVDVLEEWPENESRWQPGNEATKRLVLAWEACRDINALASSIAPGAAARRLLKQLTVPICSLMDQVDRLMTMLNTPDSRAERAQWPRADERLYLEHGRALRKHHKNGPVRVVRHKLGAHLDCDAIGTVQEKLRAKEVLPVLDVAAVLYHLILKHERAFVWIRPVHDPRGHAVETFFSYPVCVRWLTDDDGRVLDVGNVQLAEDPKRMLVEEALAAARTYNSLVERTGAGLRLIVFRETSGLLREEQAATSTLPPQS